MDGGHKGNTGTERDRRWRPVMLGGHRRDTDTEGGRRCSPVTGGSHRLNMGPCSDRGMEGTGQSRMERREARDMDMGASMGAEVSIGGARRKGIGGSRSTRGRDMAWMRGLGGTGSLVTMVKSKGKDMATLNMVVTLMMRKRRAAATTTTTTMTVLMMTKPFPLQLSDIGVA